MMTKSQAVGMIKIAMDMLDTTEIAIHNYKSCSESKELYNLSEQSMFRMAQLAECIISNCNAARDCIVNQVGIIGERNES